MPSLGLAVKQKEAFGMRPTQCANPRQSRKKIEPKERERKASREADVWGERVRQSLVEKEKDDTVTLWQPGYEIAKGPRSQRTQIAKKRTSAREGREDGKIGSDGGRVVGNVRAHERAGKVDLKRLRRKDGTREEEERRATDKMSLSVENDGQGRAIVDMIRTNIFRFTSGIHRYWTRSRVAEMSLEESRRSWCTRGVILPRLKLEYRMKGPGYVYEQRFPRKHCT
ncbi:hypothetical protein B0H12DRAFT_1132254 [Mycena haematopus]|nr:hypothetical protein B0H12DRAFT_1132254 [Mycena haematopus]